MKDLENKAENKFAKRVEEDDYVALKLNLHGRRGWPDRLVLLTFPHFFFLEFKREGEEARKLQKYIHKILRGLGYGVWTVDTYEEALEIYERFKKKARRKEKSSARKTQ